MVLVSLSLLRIQITETLPAETEPCRNTPSVHRKPSELCGQSCVTKTQRHIYLGTHRAPSTTRTGVNHLPYIITQWHIKVCYMTNVSPHAFIWRVLQINAFPCRTKSAVLTHAWSHLWLADKMLQSESCHLFSLHCSDAFSARASKHTESDQQPGFPVSLWHIYLFKLKNIRVWRVPALSGPTGCWWFCKFSHDHDLCYE